MGARSTAKKQLSEQEIDQIVIAQADDDSAWAKPVRVPRAKAASLSIPGHLAARAAFPARVHRQKTVEEWLTRVIQERVELEEAAFMDMKQELATRTG